MAAPKGSSKASMGTQHETLHPAVNFSPIEGKPAASGDAATGDDREGRVYVYHMEQIALAVRTAAATGRPLLISGPSGCGKSSLARHVANHFKARFYELVVTSRTESRDLLYRFDAVRRLSDAQSRGAAESGSVLKSDIAYVEPGPLWWAIDPDSARRRGVDPNKGTPANDPNPDNPKDGWAVLLIDEIDKADVDLPNNLLVPLGSWTFQVDVNEGPMVKAMHTKPLVFITTNGERELPLAFLRRCVMLRLPRPSPDVLYRIASATFGVSDKEPEAKLLREVAEEIEHQVKEAAEDDRLLKPSTAEYLDVLRACRAFNINSTQDGRFQELKNLTLRKFVTADTDANESTL